jgi:small subunit ribosomal protein S17
MPENKIVEHNHRRTLSGVVLSNKNLKTITVEVTDYHNHPLYGKRVFSSKKYHVHDEEMVAKVGDQVKIIETRPLSATKHFRLLSIIKKAGE